MPPSRLGAPVIDLDPFGSYYFSLEIGEVEIAHFLECSGLKSTAEAFDIQEGGLNGQLHRRSGQSRWDNIVLRHATGPSIRLLEWRDAYLTDAFDTISDPERSSGAIVLHANSGESVRRYEFTGAWPVIWEGPALSSGGSALSVETLEIAHAGLSIDIGTATPPEPVTSEEEDDEDEDSGWG